MGVKTIRNGRNIQNKPANSADVAALAQVSQTTVSRVFSGKSNVKEETKRRVYEAAKELRYRPNALAGSLNSQRSGLIALLALDLVNPHMNMMVNRVTNRIQEMGYQTLLFLSSQEENLDTALARVLAYRIDAIIVLSAALSSEMGQESVGLTGSPVVVINKFLTNSNFFSVCTDNVGTGRFVAEYLYKKGRRRFAYIGSDSVVGTSADRMKGYIEYLDERGSGRVDIEWGSYEYAGGYTAMKRILKKDTPNPDAVFCIGDLMAIGAVDCIRGEFGLRVPEDIAVVGCDNIDSSTWKAYRLTTLEQNIDEMIDEAMLYLKKSLGGKSVEGGYKLFPCRLVERDTV